ncbi:MAG: hypothetical protein A2Y33_11535 [Spirochaetes bacterium GWF1_51_8]|nr:MAG: hypothetical protein A2Y33_11535 [Spirochaetes bacterium GWF1_51_8]
MNIKTALIFILICLTYGLSFAKTTGWEIEGLKPGVKTMKIKMYQMDPDNGKQVLTSTIVESFTKEGLLYLHEYSTADGSFKVASSLKCKTDSAGNVIEKKEFEGGQLLLTVAIQYDKNGKITVKNSVSAYSEEPPVTERFTYDQSGKLLKIEKTVAGMGKETLQYLYDGTGKISAEKWQSELQAAPEWSVIYMYNSIGQVFEKQGMIPELGEWGSEKFMYDTKGNVSKKETWVLAETDGVGEMVKVSELVYETVYW